MGEARPRSAQGRDESFMRCRPADATGAAPPDSADVAARHSPLLDS